MRDGGRAFDMRTPPRIRVVVSGVLRLSLFSLILFTSASTAQSVRDERADGSGPENHAFRVAAEEQHRDDWPIKSLGQPGTAERLTFDPRNADADLITDVGYGTTRLLATERMIAAAIGMPQTDFIRTVGSHTSANVDMEFNKYLRHAANRVTEFDFNLARFASALQQTDLPRPIIIGIRSNHCSLNHVTLLTPEGSRTVEGVVFLGIDDVKPSTNIRWRAQVHLSGYVMALLVCGAVLFLPLTMLRLVTKKNSRPQTPAASMNPAEVQKMYDKSPGANACIDSDFH